MAGYTVLKRLERIVRTLDRKPYLSKDELLQRLQEEQNIQVTSRTLERDMRSLQYDFGINILYDRAENGYIIDYLDKANLADFFRLADLHYLGELIKISMTDRNLLREKIVVEDGSGFRNLGYIQPLILAIQKGRTVRFNYRKFSDDLSSNMRHVVPLQMREYLNRWYLVGVRVGVGGLRTFGLDRMQGLVTAEKNKTDIRTELRMLAKFDQIVGLDYNASKEPVTVELNVDKRQINYLRSLPLHHSQRVKGQTGEGLYKVTFWLIPNFEFSMKLLGMGDQIEVVSPEWLRNEIKQKLTNALNFYHDKKEEK